MNAPVVSPSGRSHWTGLDVVVLEEIDALSSLRRPHRRSPLLGAAGFVSDDDFLLRSMRFLAEHRDPAALVARLSAAYPLPPPAEPGTERQSDCSEQDVAAARGQSGAAAESPGADTDEDEAGGGDELR